MFLIRKWFIFFPPLFKFLATHKLSLNLLFQIYCSWSNVMLWYSALFSIEKHFQRFPLALLFTHKQNKVLEVQNVMQVVFPLGFCLVPQSEGRVRHIVWVKLWAAWLKHIREISKEYSCGLVKESSPSDFSLDFIRVSTQSPDPIQILRKSQAGTAEDQWSFPKIV